MGKKFAMRNTAVLRSLLFVAAVVLLQSTVWAADATNHPPKFTAAPTVNGTSMFPEVFVNEATKFSAKASDDDGDKLTYT